MCQIVVKEVQNLQVLTESWSINLTANELHSHRREKLESMSPYLGLRYPASDIPKQSNCLPWTRLIPDRNYQPAELILFITVTNSPLDMSLSVLRSFFTYRVFKNMGVTASMSISLIKDKKLWGLIACHHQSTKYKVWGTYCLWVLGQVASLEFTSKEYNEDLD